MSTNPEGDGSAYPHGYDPRTIEAAANAKFDNNDLAGAQMEYQQALLDWVDHAREGSDADPAQMCQAIVDLWIAYANLNRKASMFKSATDTFEAAVNCEISGSNGRIWLEYARFQEQRKRHKTAQKIFLRALVGDDNSKPGADEKYHPLLWNEFLRMMRDLNNNPSLTLQELRSAVEKEHVAQMKQNPSGGAEGDGAVSEEGPALKRPKIEESTANMGKFSQATMFQTLSRPTQTTVAPAVQLVTAKGIATETEALLNKMQKLSPDLTAAWFARDGDSPPSRPEPPLFSPSPPKFSDATGKDILGDELALQLIRMLLKKDEVDESGSILLEICRGCWMMSALKEKEAEKSLEALDQKMTDDLEALESTLETRASVAGGALSAVEQINESERNNFLSACNQQRQQLIDFTAWQFRELLAVQQQILTRANLPGFDGPTVDASTISLQANVCAFMHSAFYLRARIGEKQHLAMLTSQEVRLAEAKKAAPPLPPPPLPPPPPQPGQPFPPTQNFPPGQMPPQVQYQQLPYQQQYAGGHPIGVPMPMQGYAVPPPGLAFNSQMHGVPQPPPGQQHQVYASQPQPQQQQQQQQHGR